MQRAKIYKCTCMCIYLHVQYYGTEKRSFNAFKVHVHVNVSSGNN